MKKLALIISYRDREAHLNEFLKLFPQKIKLFSKLFSGPIDYHIFIIEQANHKPFNRGKLFNVGFALTKDHYDYFCFHDVDLIPTFADYSYVVVPTHLAADVEQFRSDRGYGLAYHKYFGGVVLFNKEDFIKINGFSNEYWGYGAEDDDLLHRIEKSKLKWTRRSGVYDSLQHMPTSGTADHLKNQKRLKNIKENIDIDESGLSNLQFILKKEEHFPTHTFYSVDI